MSTSPHEQGIWELKTANLVGFLKSSKKVRIVLAAWFSVVVVLLAAFSFPASADTVADERQFVQLINDLRESKGLQPLLIDNELKVGSRSWSREMANNNDLAHAADLSSGVTSNWSVLGENVGVTSGSNVGVLFDKFVASPDHLRNLVDPEFSHVGVGVVYDAEGKLWTTHRFMAVPGTNPPPVTIPPTTVAPKPAPVPMLPPEPQSTTVAPKPAPVPTSPPEPQPSATVAPPVTTLPVEPPTTSATLDAELLADVLKELESA